MKTPAQVYAASSRPYTELPDLKEVADGIWIVSFMHCDLGYIHREQKTLQPLDNAFGARLLPMS